jgi:hypothetical protein
MAQAKLRHQLDVHNRKKLRENQAANQVQRGGDKRSRKPCFPRTPLPPSTKPFNSKGCNCVQMRDAANVRLQVQVNSHQQKLREIQAIRFRGGYQGSERLIVEDPKPFKPDSSPNISKPAIACRCTAWRSCKTS